MRTATWRARVCCGIGCAVLALWACHSAAGPAWRAAAAPAPAPDPVERGVVLYQQGQYAQAEVVLRDAQGVEAKAYLAASLAKQQKFVEAEAPARSALEGDATHAVGVAALGESLVGQKKYDEAVERLNAAVQAKADLAYAYYWLGQAHYKKGQVDKMARHFDRFLQLAPEAPEAASVRQLLASLR